MLNFFYNSQMFCCGGLGLCPSLCYYHACQNLFVHVCDFMFHGTFCGTGAQSRVCERWYLSSSCVWIMEAWVKWSHITTDSPETPNKRPGFHQCVCLSHCMYTDIVTAAIKVIVSHRIRYLMDTKALHPPFYIPSHLVLAIGGGGYLRRPITLSHHIIGCHITHPSLYPFISVLSLTRVTGSRMVSSAMWWRTSRNSFFTNELTVRREWLL